MNQSRIYLDHAATTPLLPEARAAIAEANGRWHNPSSAHAEGRAARAALDQARARIAAALGWQGPVIFTSGASEALTIALQRTRAGRRCISSVEHEVLARAAPDAAILPVGPDGIVSLDTVAGERPLVAVQHANNETGIIQPMAAIAETVRARGGLLLVDCAQTASKLPLPDADMIAIAAHKFGGPPGVGALLVRDLALLEPVGGQEQGYRYGTENLPGIMGMAAALEAPHDWIATARQLREELEERIVAAGGKVVGGESPRIPTIGAYRMPGVASKVQLIQFDLAGVAVSAGSACSSGSLKPSRIFAAIGWDDEAAGEVVRVSFGRTTSQPDIDRFVALWVEVAARRRAA
ncbi:MAG: cysteine desulfurase family protein [Sphingomonadales bacterium]